MFFWIASKGPTSVGQNIWVSNCVDTVDTIKV